MRLLALVLFGLPLAVATVIEAGRGDAFSMALALGTLGPLVFVATATALMRAMTPSPRKADPAKIARLERELDMAPSEDPRRSFTLAERRAIDLADATRLNGNARRTFIADYLEGYAQGLAEEAPTTVAKPPAERNVDDCPRPEGCVMAHPCWKCGAAVGEPCVGDGDLHLDTRALAQSE